MVFRYCNNIPSDQAYWGTEKCKTACASKRQNNCPLKLARGSASTIGLWFHPSIGTENDKGRHPICGHMVKVVVLELLSPIRSHPVRATKDGFSEISSFVFFGETPLFLMIFEVWTKSNTDEAYPGEVTSVGIVDASL
jgi:hypothetical protein